MKTYVLGFTFGIVVSLLVGAVQARDDGRYMQSPLKPWLTVSGPARGRVVQMPMVLQFQIRIGNPRTAIIVSASKKSGSRFPMMP
jgi:hypothetical protein